jgi:cellobiose phosphorylase
MYRLLVETLLGVNLEGDRLRITPRFPNEWTTYKIHYRYRQTLFHITITRLAADSPDAPGLSLDGSVLAEDTIPLADDRREHFVDVRVR